MRGQFKAAVMAGALLAAGLSMFAAGPVASAATLTVDTSGYPCANGVCSMGLGNVGMTFQNDPFADGGTLAPSNADYRWTVVGGSLPAGLWMDPALGWTSTQLYGTPTMAGTSTFTLQVTDDAGATARQAFSITIGTGNLDRVVIIRAQYTVEGQKLVVGALDANTAAALTVSLTSTGKRIGTLSTFGTGGFFGTFFGPDGTLIPQNITVTSSLGGSATSPVTLVPKHY
jgi:hypothetical protein